MRLKGSRLGCGSGGDTRDEGGSGSECEGGGRGEGAGRGEGEGGVVRGKEGEGEGDSLCEDGGEGGGRGVCISVSRHCRTLSWRNSRFSKNCFFPSSSRS